MLILQAVPAFDVFSLFVSISTFTVERSWLHVLYTDFTIISTWLQLYCLFQPSFFGGGSKNMVQNCLKPTTASRSTGVPTHGWCHYVGNQMVEVIETDNRNTNNVKIAFENANLCRKICDMCILLKYVNKCNNKRNMRQSHKTDMSNNWHTMWHFSSVT